MDQDYFKIHQNRKYWVRKKLLRRYEEFQRRKNIEENHKKQDFSKNSKETNDSF